MAKIDDLKAALATAQQQVADAQAAIDAYHKSVVQASINRLAPNQNVVFVQMGDDTALQWTVDDASAALLVASFSAWSGSTALAVPTPAAPAPAPAPTTTDATTSTTSTTSTTDPTTAPTP